MKLYTTPGGQWAGTEKNWKAALKAEGIEPKTYTGRSQIEVPTSKPELLEFLTFYSVNVIAPRGDASAAAAPMPPMPAAAAVTTVTDVEALRAQHNPGSVEHLSPPATVSQIVTNTAGQVINLDELFVAAPIPKQVELAVGLLDRLESKTR